MLSIKDGILVCPSGSNHGHSNLPVGEILRIEARLPELAIATRLKAPELLHAFNLAWLECHKLIVLLGGFLAAAKKTAGKRKGVVILEVVPQKLQQMKIASTADTRQAVLDTDEEYEACLDEQQQIEAAIELFKGKMKAFENAFTGVKKVIGDANSYMNNRNNPSLSGD